MILSLYPPIRGLILDMDGVLWRGSAPIGDIPGAFKAIRALNMPVVMATNNATLSAQQYREKLKGFGVEIEEQQIVNSAQALTYGLSQQFPSGGPVYIVGEEGLRAALEEGGFYPADNGEVLAVVAGLDRGITYQKIKRATLLIRGGVPFLGTNPDRTYPAPEGQIPGAGSILAAIEAATDTPPLIAGKPNRLMFDLALQRLGTSPAETLMVGDRLDTDIAGAQRVGCRTAAVLTGVSTPEQAAAWEPAPDLIAPNLWSLLAVTAPGEIA